jgi:hypothetical protein
MQLCFVDEGLPADSPAKPILRRALDLIHIGLDEGRRALLGLRSAALPEGSLEKALGDVRDALSPGSRTRLSIVVLGESRPLIPAVRDQVYWSVEHFEDCSIQSQASGRRFRRRGKELVLDDAQVGGEGAQFGGEAMLGFVDLEAILED